MGTNAEPFAARLEKIDKDLLKGIKELV